MWWFLYGLILGAMGMRIGSWIYEDKISLRWYTIVLFTVSLFFATLAVQHFFASYKEMERRAAWVGAFMLGVPAILLTALALCLVLAGIG